MNKEIYNLPYIRNLNQDERIEMIRQLHMLPISLGETYASPMWYPIALLTRVLADPHITDAQIAGMRWIFYGTNTLLNRLLQALKKSNLNNSSTYSNSTFPLPHNIDNNNNQTVITNTLNA